MRRLIPLALVVLAITACDPTSPYAAIVNGTRISQHELTRELNALRANTAFVTAYDQGRQQAGLAGVVASNSASTVYSQSFVSTLLGIDIEGAIVHTEVQRRHLEPSSQVVDDPATVSAAGQQFGTDIFAKFPAWLRRQFQLRQAEQDALGKDLGSKPVTDQDITNYYNDNPGSFTTSACVSHILLKTEGAAEAVVAQIRGGTPFPVAAAQSSTDSSTASHGGALGCGPPGQGANPIEQDQAFATAQANAQIGVPVTVQVAGGWDVFEVTQRTLTPLTDDLRQQIRTDLQTQAGLPLNAWFQQAAKTLKVSISPIYGHWDPQQLTVVPPSSPDPARSGLPVAQSPGVQTPSAQNPAGQDQTGQNPAGQNPAGQNPTGQDPTGQDQTGANPAGQNPVGQDQTGANPAGQNPAGQNPVGQDQTGQVPAGATPTPPPPTTAP